MKVEKLVLLVLCTAFVMSMAPALASAQEAAEEKERVPIKPVLLVIDVQNQWMPMMAEDDRATAPDTINAAIAMFREYGYPVIRVYHSDPKRGPERGTEEFEFPRSIAVTDADPMVVKTRGSSFIDTDLEQMLKDADRNVVFMCGLSATGCVLATYFGGQERGFTCLMVKEALLSANSEYTDVIEDICYSISLADLKGVMEDPYFE